MKVQYLSRRDRSLSKVTIQLKHIFKCKVYFAQQLTSKEMDSETAFKSGRDYLSFMLTNAIEKSRN